MGHGKVTTVTSFRVFAMTCKGVVYGNCGYLDKLSQSVKAMTECRNLRLETISRVAGNWDPRVTVLSPPGVRLHAQSVGSLTSLRESRMRRRS